MCLLLNFSVIKVEVKIVDISKCFLFQEELALLRGHERPSLDMTEVKCRVFYFMASIKALKEVVQRARDMFKCLFLYFILHTWNLSLYGYKQEKQICTGSICRIC